MKIEDLRKKEPDFEFNDLIVGDVFKKEISYGSNWTFMKILRVVEPDRDDGGEEERYNAVCLDDGDLCWFEWNDKVVKVEAKVVIEK
jgi:hypothetical protein